MNNFIEKYPNHLRAKPMYFYLGNHYFQKKDFKAAAQTLEKIYEPDYDDGGERRAAQ